MNNPNYKIPMLLDTLNEERSSKLMTYITINRLKNNQCMYISQLHTTI